MCSGEGDWTCLQPGFPIRKSSDHSLVIDSPRLIADSYVLLRFLVPRHPPCALKNLSHKDARVHCVVLKTRAVPHHHTDAYHHETEVTVRPPARSDTGQPAGPKEQARRPNPQDPTTCQAPTPTTRFPLPTPTTAEESLYSRGHTRPTPNNRCSTHEHLLPDTRRQTRPWTTTPHPTTGHEARQPAAP
jgi:hypothetical protein